MGKIQEGQLVITIKDKSIIHLLNCQGTQFEKNFYQNDILDNYSNQMSHFPDHTI